MRRLSIQLECSSAVTKFLTNTVPAGPTPVKGQGHQNSSSRSLVVVDAASWSQGYGFLARWGTNQLKLCEQLKRHVNFSWFAAAGTSGATGVTESGSIFTAFEVCQTAANSQTTCQMMQMSCPIDTVPLLNNLDQPAS